MNVSDTPESRRHEWQCQQGRNCPDDEGYERKRTPSGLVLAAICLGSVFATLVLMRAGWLLSLEWAWLTR